MTHSYLSLQKRRISEATMSAYDPVLEAIVANISERESLEIEIGLLARQIVRHRRNESAEFVRRMSKLQADLVTAYKLLRKIADDGDRRAMLRSVWSRFDAR